MKRKIITVIAVIVVIILLCGIYYVNDYYHADKSVETYMKSSENVTIVNSSNWLFLEVLEMTLL